MVDDLCGRDLHAINTTQLRQLADRNNLSSSGTREEVMAGVDARVKEQTTLQEMKIPHAI